MVKNIYFQYKKNKFRINDDDGGNFYISLILEIPLGCHTLLNSLVIIILRNTYFNIF